MPQLDQSVKVDKKAVVSFAQGKVAENVNQFLTKKNIRFFLSRLLLPSQNRTERATGYIQT